MWGNHRDRKIRDLFTATFDQTEILPDDRVEMRITLDHYPMLTWNAQHHGSVDAPNIHLYGHVHALYQKNSGACPLLYADAWPALDVGFDGHDYQVWIVGRDSGVPTSAAGGKLEELKKEPTAM